MRYALINAIGGRKAGEVFDTFQGEASVIAGLIALGGALAVLPNELVESASTKALTAYGRGAGDEVATGIMLGAYAGEPSPPPAHASSHLPSGSDPLTTASGVAIGGGNATGTADAFARSDHGHALRESGGPTALTLAGIADGTVLRRFGTTIVGQAFTLAALLLVGNTTGGTSIELSSGSEVVGAAGVTAVLRGGPLGGGVSCIGGTALTALSAGTIATLQGGPGGTTSGAGGVARMLGGTPIDGDGGACIVSGANGVGTNRSGGSFTTTAGNATGSGAAGTIAQTAGSGGATSAGGAWTATAGAGGSTSGNGGTATLQGGVPIFGTGGGVTIRARPGVGLNQNGGQVQILAGAATGFGVPGVVLVQPGNTNSFIFSTVAMTMLGAVRSIAWDDAVLTPAIVQQLTASALGQLMTVAAQGAFGVGAVGGALTIGGGQGAATSGATTVGGALLLRGGDVANAATVRTGGKTTVRGGELGHIGGDVLIRPGTGTTAHGNTAFGLDPASYQTMQRGMFVADSVASPTANPASGLFLYAVSGEPEWRTSGGTRIRWQAAAATAGVGVGVLPLAPEEFLTITFNGAVRKIPLYLT